MESEIACLLLIKRSSIRCPLCQKHGKRSSNDGTKMKIQHPLVCIGVHLHNFSTNNFKLTKFGKVKVGAFNKTKTIPRQWGRASWRTRVIMWRVELKDVVSNPRSIDRFVVLQRYHSTIVPCHIFLIVEPQSRVITISPCVRGSKTMKSRFVTVRQRRLE